MAKLKLGERNSTEVSSETCLTQNSQSERREGLICKLTDLFEQQLAAIEKQGDGRQRLETLERDCRALEVLARTFDRLVQAEMRTMVSSGPATARSSTKTSAEAIHDKASSSVAPATTSEELREKLARRLYGLQQPNADSAPSEHSQPG